MKHKRMAGLLAGLMLYGCISVPVLAAESTVSLPQAFQTNQRAITEYHLSKYDVINIVIIGYDENNNSNTENSMTNKAASSFSNIMIGPDGYVNLPYAGAVKLAGLTVSEATAVLTARIGEYIKIPGMSIMISQYGPRKIYVMGEVGRQGIYDLGIEYMNVFAAISSAGGIGKYGRPKHITVVRMLDGKVQMQEVNFDRFIEKQDASQNIALQDGDMVYVPKSNKVDLYTDIMPLVNVYATFRALTN